MRHAILAASNINLITQTVPNRRTRQDEDDSLMNYSSIAVYLNIVYHLIVGCYYAIFSKGEDGTGKSSTSCYEIIPEVITGS